MLTHNAFRTMGQICVAPSNTNFVGLLPSHLHRPVTSMLIAAFRYFEMQQLFFLSCLLSSIVYIIVFHAPNANSSLFFAHHV